MNRIIGMTLAVLFGFAGLGHAGKVYVDYDRQADFGAYKTYAWLPAKGFNLADVNELLHLRVKNYIEDKLEKGGYLLVEKNPDFLVTYYTASKDMTKINVVSMGYAYGPGWGWDPYWTGYWGWGYGGSHAASGQVAVYTKGTLIIDVIDARTKQLIWRGTLKDSVPDNPDKISKKIYKGIDKIIRKWHAMRKEQLAQEAKGS